MTKEKFINNIIANLDTGDKMKVEIAIKNNFDNLFYYCYNDLTTNEKIDLINDFCKANHYEPYEKATNENICLLFNNNALDVANFIKKYSDYELNNGYLHIDGYGHIELIREFDILKLYKNDNNFINWLIDYDKLNDYCEIMTEKDEITKEIKKQVKKTFINVKFYLYQKDYTYLLKLKDYEAEPKYLEGYIHIIKCWDGSNGYENIAIYNGKQYNVNDDLIKYVEGYDHIANHRLKCPSISFMQIENCKYIKKINQCAYNNEIVLKIGSYDYLKEHCSGGGCNGELCAYYLSLLKDYNQIVFIDNGKIYDQRNGKLTEYNPLKASQSEKTREKIASFISWLWGEIKRYNEQRKEN